MLDDWKNCLQFTIMIRKLEWMGIRGAFGSLWRWSNYRILTV